MENFNRQLVLAHYMTVDISFNDGRLSICGETEDSAGQIIGELDDLLKYGPNEHEKTIIVKLRDIWERWHLNHMRPGCEHQREWDVSEMLTVGEKQKAAGWVYPTEHPKGLLCKPCEICGYKYGSAWLKEEVPADVLDYLKTLGTPA
tara:strand:- start:394 stop:834 length:441 start_codon:yes stop_codon:yes gene_type:complete